MDTFIVRVYRRDRKNPRRVAGVVEVSVDGKTTAFHGVEELEGILLMEKGEVRSRGQRREGGKQSKKGKPGA